MEGLSDLNFSVRLVLFGTLNVVLFYWARYVVAPASVGWKRVVRAVPLLPVLWLVSVLFFADRPEEFILAGYSAFNFLWLTLSKLWSFCLNRGQLVKSYESGSGVAFALALLSPVNVAFEEKPVEESKGHETKERHAYEDARFAVIGFSWKGVVREMAEVSFGIAVKVGVMFVTSVGYLYLRDSEYLFWRDYCLSWYAYAVISTVQALNNVFIMLALNLKLESSFNTPWTAQSVGEVWAKHYDLVFAEALRDLVYDPISEGRWIRGSKYFEKSSSSNVRRAVATLATFSASGVLHAFFLWFSFSMEPPILVGFFFAANGVFVVFENLIKASLKVCGAYDAVSTYMPSLLCIVYTNIVVFSLGHLLFWPDLIKTGYADDMIGGFTVFLPDAVKQF